MTKKPTHKELAEELARLAINQELNIKTISAFKGLAESEGLEGVTRDVAALAREYVQREFRRRADEVEEKEKKPSIATVITNMAINADILFFRDQTQQAHAKLKVDDHWEIWPVRSKQFKDYLIYTYRASTGSVPNSNAVRDAAMALSAHAAAQKGPVYPLHNRVAWFEDSIWYDMTNKNWEVVRINENGWEVLSDTPIPLFCRFDHHAEQVMPTNKRYRRRAAHHRRAILYKLMRFHNLANIRNRILDKVNLVFSLVPDVPHPMSNVYGPAGSGKTLGFHRTIKLLVDPSNVDQGLPWPKKDGDVPIQFERHYYLIYSNLSWMSRGMSDHLCRAIDGAADETRRLYTDREMISFKYLRCVGINAIPVVATQEDLMDRSLLFELDTIMAENRIDEDELKSSFELVRPDILGAMFDTLAAAMKIRPTIELGYIERMGAFTKWGCAIAEALGYEHEEFLEAYATNRMTANEEIVNSNILARVTMEFMRSREEWRGAPKVLFIDLTEFEFGNKKTHKDWPKDVARMSKQYARIKQPLYRSGLDIEMRRSTEREIIMTWRDKYGPKLIQRTFDKPKDGQDRETVSKVSKVSSSLLHPSSVPLFSQKTKEGKKEGDGIKKEESTDFTDFTDSQSFIPSLDGFIEEPSDKSDMLRPKKIKKSKRKPLLRTVKSFSDWLEKLPNAGQRGFRESEAQKIYGDDYLEELSNWVDRGWLTQRDKSLVWWVSDEGASALAGGYMGVEGDD